MSAANQQTNRFKLTVELEVDAASFEEAEARIWHLKAPGTPMWIKEHN